MLNKKRLLIFVVAYNAEKTISKVLTRIPVSLLENFDMEVLVIDDASTDNTFRAGLNAKEVLSLPFAITILKNPINQGYGGNQKIGYHYAIENNFDYVALIHGDGQYAPECLPELMEPFRDKKVGAVFGSRMLSRWSALKGGMPLYKYVGNKILTHFENWMLDSSLSEFHSGYRIYTINALKKIPFDLNTNDFHFDTEIIIQFVVSDLIIKELPIPTYYGDEICHVNGMKYAFDVVLSVLRMRAQRLNILYDRKFDVQQDSSTSNIYDLKLDGVSPHTVTLGEVAFGSSVLDLGCASGYVSAILKRDKNCFVVGVDFKKTAGQEFLDQFVEHDLFSGPPQLSYNQFNYILMLDVIEHLPNPEQFVNNLYSLLGDSNETKILVSTGNVGFIVTRLMLLFGYFNYGKKGILDLTHTRLFTFSTLRKLFEQHNYQTLSVRGIPTPFALAMGAGKLSRFMNIINLVLIQICPGLFSYQIFMEFKPRPSLKKLLGHAKFYSQSQ